MSFGETKVYFDGSHYIAIPHTTRPSFKKPKVVEEKITVIESKEDSAPTTLADVPSLLEDNSEEIVKENDMIQDSNIKKTVKRLTRKELFNELYMKYINLSKRERKQTIIKEMLSYFKKEQHCIDFVNINLERKQLNLICRRVRMCRKANLANFNYFCTFTYNDKLHSETSFKKALKTCFRNLCYRKGWKYMGVWERAPKTNRLHFHGLFYVPDITILELITVKDYDTISHKMQESNQ